MGTRVLVVDDAVLFRRIVSEVMAGIPGVEVAGSASNGKLALSRLSTLAPDLMTLDIEMPEMNGIEVLEALQAAGSTTGVIVLSSQTKKGSALTVRALELGAFDFLTKPEAATPEANLLDLRARMLPIVRAFERRNEIRSILSALPPMSNNDAPKLKSLAQTQAPGMDQSNRPLRRNSPPLVLIGVSTGGPAALAQVVPALDPQLRAPVFIVQHMPPLFTEALAASLHSRSKLPVKEASDGETAFPGHVYIAPGGRQMKIVPGSQGEVKIQVNDDAPENNCRPSVDYLFRSAALHFPGRSIAAILTGMGNDGAQGLKMLKRGGCYSLAQDEASCVVFGMPREAILTGMVDQICPLSRVAQSIQLAIHQAIGQGG